MLPVAAEPGPSPEDLGARLNVGLLWVQRAGGLWRRAWALTQVGSGWGCFPRVWSQELPRRLSWRKVLSLLFGEKKVGLLGRLGKEPGSSALHVELGLPNKVLLPVLLSEWHACSLVSWRVVKPVEAQALSHRSEDKVTLMLRPCLPVSESTAFLSGPVESRGLLWFPVGWGESRR